MATTTKATLNRIARSFEQVVPRSTTDTVDEIADAKLCHHQTETDYALTCRKLEKLLTVYK